MSNLCPDIPCQIPAPPSSCPLDWVPTLLIISVAGLWFGDFLTPTLSLWCLLSLSMSALPPTNGIHPQLLLYHPCCVQRLLRSPGFGWFLSLPCISSCNFASLLTNFFYLFPDNSTSEYYQTLQCSFHLPHFCLTISTLEFLSSWTFTQSAATSAFKVAASPSSGFWCHFFHSFCLRALGFPPSNSNRDVCVPPLALTALPHMMPWQILSFLPLNFSLSFHFYCVSHPSLNLCSPTAPPEILVRI